MDKLKLGGAASSMQEKLFGESFHLFEQKDCLNDSLSGAPSYCRVYFSVGQSAVMQEEKKLQ